MLAQQYLEMGQKIGESDSAKVMFMDPGNIPATIEGVKAIVADAPADSDGMRNGITNALNNTRG